VKCGKCEKGFKEKLEEARACVIAGRDFLCLACDEDATEPALIRVL
jgi:hypothetical protein